MTLSPLVLALIFMIRARPLEPSLAEDTAQETAWVLAIAVDEYFKSSIRVLETLGASGTLDDRDFPRFFEEARRVRDLNRGWTGVVLVNPSAAQHPALIGSFGSGTDSATSQPYSDIRVVAATGVPQISDLGLGSLFGRNVITISVPVFRHRRVRYVLVASLNAEALSGLLRQRLPSPEWIATLRDRRDRVIARSRDIARYIGQPPSRDLSAALETARSNGAALVESKPVDKTTPVYTAVRLAPTSEFLVVVAVPATGIALSHTASGTVGTPSKRF